MQDNYPKGVTPKSRKIFIADQNAHYYGTIYYKFYRSRGSMIAIVCTESMINYPTNVHDIGAKSEFPVKFL